MKYDALLKFANKFYRLATIVHPPRNVSQFLISLPKQLQKEIDLLSMYTLQGVSHSEVLNDFFSEFYYRDVLGDLGGFKYVIQRVTKLIENIAELASVLVTRPMASYDRIRYTEYAVGYLHSIKEDLPKFKERLEESLNSYQDVDEKVKYFTVDPAGIDYRKKYYANIPIEYVTNVFKVSAVVDKILFITDSAISKLQELVRILKAYDDRELRPTSEKIETLYHATANAKNIIANGFKQGIVQVEGLGGNSTNENGTPTVSFTSDLYVAKEVARCLKEVIMIANEELSARHILSWAEYDGIKDTVINSLAGLIGNKTLDKPHLVMELYNVYLHHSKRYNPLFVGNMRDLMKNLRGKSHQDVGIISAQVDMTSQEIMFLPAMHEYRVPVNAILKVNGLI